ncbi:MAG: phosphatase PAP2 family protein [Deltaproteobacteria bacterium]|nr:phosphatase PAP2 family protein [Deltaproteobacteria bacterium]
MTPRERFYKALLFIGTVIYYVGGYLVVNYLSFQRGVFHDVMLPGEDKIPFIPWFIFVYVSSYLVIIYLYLRIQSLSFFQRAILAFLICVTIHLTIFVLFPVRYNLRPLINPEVSWLMEIMDFYYWLDLPYNCFPSLHASNAFLVYLLIKKYGGREAWFIGTMAVLITISIVLVKQHYILDAVCGIPVAFVSLWLAFLKRPQESTQKAFST